jgi:hypothetical protein
MAVIERCSTRLIWASGSCSSFPSTVQSELRSDRNFLFLRGAAGELFENTPRLQFAMTFTEYIDKNIVNSSA